MTLRVVALLLAAVIAAIAAIATSPRAAMAATNGKLVPAEIVMLTSDGSASNGNSTFVAASDDLRYVLFTSNATNLIAGTSVSQNRIYVRDRQAATTVLVANAPYCCGADMSGDGRFVVFPASGGLYRWDRQTATTSSVDSTFTAYYSPSISDSGDVIAYERIGSGVVARRVSTGQEWLIASGSPAGRAVVSGDGTKVVFDSNNSTLVADDTNGSTDVFIYDLTTGIRSVLSRNGQGVTANGHSSSPVVSSDGRTVAFHTEASDIADGAGGALAPGLVVLDRTDGTRVSVPAGAPYQVTPGDAYVISWSGLWVFDVTTRSLFASAMSVSCLPSFSAEARVGLCTHSDALPGDTNSRSDIYVMSLQLAPSAPTAVTATSGNKAATVSWSPPLTDGGSAITSYKVTASPGGQTVMVNGSTTTATLGGLTNGVSYTFTVKATNAVGDGPASDPSNAITPATVPGMPTGVMASRGDGSATVSWSAPSSNGGSGITGYTVMSSPGGHTAAVSGSATQATVSGLTNGTSYVFSVKATNAVGDGPASDPSNAVVPAAVPGKPASVTASRGDASAVVSWSAPASNGGSGITGYTVTSNPGAHTTTVDGSATQATVSGLTNGISYTFSVRATNAVGDGSESDPSEPVTPQDATPPAVSMTRPSTAFTVLPTLTAKWSASDAGSGVQHHDSRWRSARFDGALTAWNYPVHWQDLSAATVTLPSASRGLTYCFSARSTDGVGNTSSWAAPRCTAIPLDERAATLSSGWVKKGDSRYFAGTYITTSSRGAKVTSPTFSARRLALLATRCPRCGTITASVGGSVIKTIKLSASTTKRSVVIPVAHYNTAKTGKITVKVISTDKKVEIDGIGVSK